MPSNDAIVNAQQLGANRISDNVIRSNNWGYLSNINLPFFCRSLPARLLLLCGFPALRIPTYQFDCKMKRTTDNINEKKVKKNEKKSEKQMRKKVIRKRCDQLRYR